MDRSWLHGTLFSDESVSGVKESMDFIKENFSDNDDSGGDDRVEGILRDLQTTEELMVKIKMETVTMETQWIKAHFWFMR